MWVTKILITVVSETTIKSTIQPDDCQTPTTISHHDLPYHTILKIVYWLQGEVMAVVKLQQFTECEVATASDTETLQN
jgi:uncharacterized membrane protein YkvI